MVSQPTGDQTPDKPETKYVDLEGDIEIGLNRDGRLTIYFVKEENGTIVIINEDKPLEVTKILQEHRLKLFGVKLIAEFTKDSLDMHLTTIRQVNPSVVNWDSSSVEKPEPATMPSMTSMGPPHN